MLYGIHYDFQSARIIFTIFKPRTLNCKNIAMMPTANSQHENSIGMINSCLNNNFILYDIIYLWNSPKRWSSERDIGDGLYMGLEGLDDPAWLIHLTSLQIFVKNPVLNITALLCSLYCIHAQLILDLFCVCRLAWLESKQ